MRANRKQVRVVDAAAASRGCKGRVDAPLQSRGQLRGSGRIRGSDAGPSRRRRGSDDFAAAAAARPPARGPASRSPQASTLDGPATAAARAGGAFWVATATSLNRCAAAPGATGGCVWTRFAGGPGGLPFANATGLAVADDDVLVAATARGLVVADVGAGAPTFDVLAGPRWVATADARGRVVAVAASGGTVVAATTNGLSVLKRTETTLAAKAAFFQSAALPRHVRARTGLVGDLTLDAFGAVSTAQKRAPSDNSGLWTASNVAMQSFRAAAGGAPDAALAGLAALERLVNVRRPRAGPLFDAAAAIRIDRDPRRRSLGSSASPLARA